MRHFFLFVKNRWSQGQLIPMLQYHEEIVLFRLLLIIPQQIHKVGGVLLIRENTCF
jgi:hypothetical protein